jgi:PAS domain S-box-containing protein
LHDFARLFKTVAKDYKPMKTKELMSAEELLEALPVNYYVIDLVNKKIVHTNDARVTFDDSPCFRQLFQKEAPCHFGDGGCLCDSLIAGVTEASFMIKPEQGDGNRYFKARIKKVGDGKVVATYTDVTGELESAREMKINTRRMERAEKLAAFGSWEIDLQSMMMYGTKGASEIYGLDTESLPVSEVKKIALPEYREMLDRALEDLIAGRKAYQVQYRIKRPCDEQIRYIHSIAEYRKDKKMVFGVATDITEVEESQGRLHESLTDLSLAQEIAQIGNWKYDPENRNLQWSDQVLQILNQNDIPVNPGLDDFRHFTDSDQFEVFSKAIRLAIDHGKPFDQQFKINTGESVEKWIEVICRPESKKGSDGYFLRGTLQDITSGKKTEHELSDANNMLNTLVQNIPDALYMKDAQYRKVIANKGDLSNCNKKDLEEVIGKTDFDVYPKEMAEKYFQDDRQVIEEGKAVVNREETLPGDPIRWILTTKVPIKDKEGNITGLVGIGHDITHRRKMMEELEVAKLKAEESDRLKSLFLANMSHEIRTPLNAILGFSNILSTGNLEQDKLDYFAKIIDNSGKRLMTVIDDIIDVSMIQSNQLKLDYSTFNINELIEELFVLYKTQNQDQLEKLDFKVRICEDPGHCILYSDKNRLFQVLRNLLDNAFKFTEEGFIEFGLSASDKDELVLFVKDTGIGIEEEKTKIVFNTFRQAHEGLSRKYEGTGLGLSIVSGIVKQLGGNVWVESAPGQGAAFYVSVPRKTRTSQFVQQSEQRPKEDRWERRLAVKRIVSFEDDPASIQYLKSVVNLLGYELINFDLPETGIEYLRKHSADLVLMDVRLPQMTGLEATRIIKSDIPGLPVIIQTAYAMKGDREKAFEAGCDDYLTKPVSLKDLKGKIVQYIEQAN